MQAVKCGKIVTVSGGVLDHGTILVDQGKIAAVGCGIAIPERAKVVDLSDQWVTPGLIDAHTHIGLRGEPWQFSESFTDDENELTDPIQAHLRAYDAFNPFDYALGEVRRAGVTTCFTGPGAVTTILGPWPCNVIGGTGFAFKLRSANSVEKMALPGTEQMKAALGEDVLRPYGKKGKAPMTRMSAASLLRETLSRARDYERKLQGKAVGEDFRLNALLPVVRGEMKLRIHCNRADDICTAIRICREFHLDYCLEHACEAYKVLDVLEESRAFCVLGPMFGAPNKMEVWEQKLETPGILEQAGLPFCLSDDTMSETKWLPYHVGTCTAYGLSMEKAFEAITLEPARLLGIAGRVGSIEVGKDADLAVFDGHPLSNLTNCVATMIDGIWEHMEL